jgi:hypothetical protein
VCEFSQDKHEEWFDKVFVGVLSYKISAKVDTVNGIVRLIENLVGKHRNSEVITLLSPRNLQLRDQAQKTHGMHFIQVFHELLRRLQFTELEIASIDNTDAVFCNYWLAKPYLMLKFIDFMGMAISMLQQDEFLRILVSADSKYREGSAAVARAVWGTPNYQLHPFICERLAAAFFWSKNTCTVYVRSEFRPPKELERMLVKATRYDGDSIAQKIEDGFKEDAAALTTPRYHSLLLARTRT